MTKTAKLFPRRCYQGRKGGKTEDGRADKGGLGGGWEGEKDEGISKEERKVKKKKCEEKCLTLLKISLCMLEGF